MDDEAFIQWIQFLIKEKVLQIPSRVFLDLDPSLTNNHQNLQSHG